MPLGTVWTAAVFFIAWMFHHFFIKGIYHSPQTNIFTAGKYKSSACLLGNHFTTVENKFFSKENKFFSVENIFSSVKNKFSILESGTH